MRICLIGEFSGNLDEGMRVVASHLAGELSRGHTVLPLDIKDLFARGFWKSVKRFEPQAIHYIPGPSLRSFLVTRALSLYCRQARIVMSALHPHLAGYSRVFIRLLKPDLILAVSGEDERMFRNLGCRTASMPPAVDTAKFVPVSEEVKLSLRQKYGLTPEGFIILHVGHIKAARGLGVLRGMQGNGSQVLVVGSTSTGVEQKARAELEDSGCLVWTGYVRDVEEIYALADCYVFPTTDRTASIAAPLSVLEAMACNLPVIASRFGALPELFDEGDGLIFAGHERDFRQGLQTVKDGVEVKNRERILPFSWTNAAEKLGEIYKEIA